MGIQNTPVDSIATVSIPQATNQATSACKSGVKVANTRTGSASRSGGTAATISALPISRPAALGKTQANSSSARFLGVFLLGIQAPPVIQRVKVSASPVMQISSLLIGVVRRYTTDATSNDIVDDREPGCSTGSVAPARVRVLALA